MTTLSNLTVVPPPVGLQEHSMLRSHLSPSLTSARVTPSLPKTRNTKRSWFTKFVRSSLSSRLMELEPSPPPTRPPSTMVPLHSFSHRRRPSTSTTSFPSPESSPLPTPPSHPSISLPLLPSHLLLRSRRLAWESRILARFRPIRHSRSFRWPTRRFLVSPMRFLTLPVEP